MLPSSNQKSYNYLQWFIFTKLKHRVDERGELHGFNKMS